MRELQHEEQDMYTKQRNDNMRGNITPFAHVGNIGRDKT